MKSTDLYTIYGRYIAPDGESDSFFLKMDNGREDIWDLNPNSDRWNTIFVTGHATGSKLDKLILIKQ